MLILPEIYKTYAWLGNYETGKFLSREVLLSMPRADAQIEHFQCRMLAAPNYSSFNAIIMELYQTLVVSAPIVDRRAKLPYVLIVQSHNEHVRYGFFDPDDFWYNLPVYMDQNPELLTESPTGSRSVIFISSFWSRPFGRCSEVNFHSKRAMASLMDLSFPEAPPIVERDIPNLLQGSSTTSLSFSTSLPGSRTATPNFLHTHSSPASPLQVGMPRATSTPVRSQSAIPPSRIPRPPSIESIRGVMGTATSARSTPPSPTTEAGDEQSFQHAIRTLCFV